MKGMDVCGLPELPDGVMPFESWEKLRAESSSAFAAFCVFRDYGPERNVRKAAAAGFSGKEQGEAEYRVRLEKRYRMWRDWAVQHRWRERAADYDRYIDGLRLEEQRKTIEERGRVHREITGKMLRVVGKKLDTMNPADLAAGTVTEWVETAIRADREGSGAAAGKAEGKQGELVFSPEFEGWTMPRKVDTIKRLVLS